ncbi:MAG: ATP-binding protein [Chloroflexi bacterium]|nr:MAG: ATP-binding protein [Chloroflexota bacterium]
MERRRRSKAGLLRRMRRSSRRRRRSGSSSNNSSQRKTQQRRSKKNNGWGSYKKRKEINLEMRYERLVAWARDVWEKRWPNRPYMTIWASAECSNMIAQNQIKPGRRLKGKARYDGVEELECPVIVPISDYGSRGRKMVLTATAGAYAFKFSVEDGDPFEVIYASSYFDDDVQDLTAIALVPVDRLDTWAAFEFACARAVRPRIRRRRDVYIIGGTDAFFDPTVEWDDVILPDDLKRDILDDIEAFFEEGVHIYRQLKLAPFRKLLLAGVPGTGKTMLCAALAKIALNKGRIVVYVSGSDRDGATFEKIQRAFQAVAAARYPTLLIVEELDAYLRGDDKARILNVLDGVESPNNPQGSLLLATTNYPEAIDERIAKRPGRLDRIFIVPTIQDDELAKRMLRYYMADQWQENHVEVVSQLIGQPGAFVREVALHARMLAAHERKTTVTLDLLQQSVESLTRQLKAERDFLLQRRPMGLVNQYRRPNTRGNSPFDSD